MAVLLWSCKVSLLVVFRRCRGVLNHTLRGTKAIHWSFISPKHIVGVVGNLHHQVLRTQVTTCLELHKSININPGSDLV